MIVDSMTKQEVIDSLLWDYNRDVNPQTVKAVLRNKALIQEQSKREKKTVYLDWEDVVSQNRVNYRYRIWGGGNTYQVMTIAEFVWRGRKCFARIEHGYERRDKTRHVWVYQQHALERYAERVLKSVEISPENVIRKYLAKPNAAGMAIALPSRTHKRTIYVGHSDALFLCEDMAINDPFNMRAWVNTCISFDEAGYTQSKIMASFKELVSIIRLLGFDPVDDRNEYRLMDKHKRELYEREIVRCFTLHYLFALLQNDYDMLATEHEKEVQARRIAFLEGSLEDFGVDYSQLNPYYENSGIASEYDLNYMPETGKEYDFRDLN